MGVNTLRLHCLLKAFDRSNSTGQIGCKSITLPVKGIEITLPVKGIEITLPVKGCLVEFGGHILNGFTPNSTGRIRLVELGVNPLHCLLKALRLHCLLKAFDRLNSTRHGCKYIEITLPVKGIRPVKFNWSNWV